MEKIIKTLAELGAEAERFVEFLIKGNRCLSAQTGLPAGRQATLVTLSGELGAGKTAFAQSVARSLGVEEIVTSPTFVLEKIYALPKVDGHVVSFKCLVHLDAYRLEKGADLAPLHFDELMQDPENLIFLEWPERVSDALPAPAVRVALTANPDGSRMLSYG